MLVKKVQDHERVLEEQQDQIFIAQSETEELESEEFKELKEKCNQLEQMVHYLYTKIPTDYLVNYDTLQNSPISARIK